MHLKNVLFLAALSGTRDSAFQFHFSRSECRQHSINRFSKTVQFVVEGIGAAAATFFQLIGLS